VTAASAGPLCRPLEEDVARVGGSLEVLSLRAAPGEDGGRQTRRRRPRGQRRRGLGGAGKRRGPGGGSGSGCCGRGGPPPPEQARPCRWALDAVTAAARGTGMVVRRVTQVREGGPRAASPPPCTPAAPLLQPGARLHCNTCDVHFEAPEQHRAHFRADLHRCAAAAALGAGARAQSRIPYCPTSAGST